MATKVYGASDDLIEVEGDVRGEVACYGAVDEEGPGVLLVFSDGTVLAVKYGKPAGGIWEVKVVHKGALLVGIEECDDEDADPYSDVATFRDGVRWAYAATEWEKV